jgi:pullulanase/glycogen debranching enzyme
MNRDGTDRDLSWNHGVEGASRDPVIEERRHRDVRSLLATLFVSRGTPMLAMGDEAGPHAERQQQRLRAGQRDNMARLAGDG